MPPIVEPMSLGHSNCLGFLAREWSRHLLIYSAHSAPSLPLPDRLL